MEWESQTHATSVKRTEKTRKYPTKVLVNLRIFCPPNRVLVVRILEPDEILAWHLLLLLLFASGRLTVKAYQHRKIKHIINKKRERKKINVRTSKEEKKHPKLIQRKRNIKWIFAVNHGFTKIQYS